ncbi:MAG: DNA recombination protein RmuC [Fidelibacterota bacterium]
MSDTYITVGLFLAGVFIGWFLRKMTNRNVSHSELESLRTQLDDSVKSGIALSTRLEETENRLSEVTQLRKLLEESQKAETAAKTRVEEISKQLVEEKARLLEIRKEMENAFKSLADDVVKSNSEEFIKLANEKFKSVLDANEERLTEKKKLIDQNLGEMSKTLKGISEQSTELNTRLQENRTETEKLRETASGLREVLSSSQKRGQWGERMVEDILQFIGLVEGINYKKQSVVESGEKPDYTFCLPKEKTLNMDVKFPLAHYEEYVAAKDEFHRNQEKTQFLKDVKNHIKIIAGREYINPLAGTLDYVMMFIPNESIYGFVNREDPDLISYALANKVLLCSPLTLYAVLSLIHQATKNFAMEEKAAEVMNQVNEFRKQWGKYTDLLDKLGRSLDTVNNDYQSITTTRSRQLEKPMRKIEELSSGAQIDLLDSES